MIGLRELFDRDLLQIDGITPASDFQEKYTAFLANLERHFGTQSAMGMRVREYATGRFIRATTESTYQADPKLSSAILDNILSYYSDSQPISTVEKGLRSMRVTDSPLTDLEERLIGGITSIDIRNVAKATGTVTSSTVASKPSQAVRQVGKVGVMAKRTLSKVIESGQVASKIAKGIR